LTARRLREIECQEYPALAFQKPLFFSYLLYSNAYALSKYPEVLCAHRKMMI
jgi:hypothetical protein